MHKLYDTSLLTEYGHSLARLEEALALEHSDVARDAAIKRFEFTFELAWKTFQKVLREEGITCQSPKSWLAEAYALGLTPDDPRWIQILEDRNLTVHTYDEKLADTVYARLPNYVELFRALHDAIEDRLRGSP